MEQMKGKKQIIFTILKIVLVIIIAGVAFYLLYFKTIQGRARLVLSDREIESSSESSKIDYKLNSRIYFYISRRFSELDGSALALEIEMLKDGTYSHYKKITYEIDKDFKKLQSYIPEEYSGKAGKYRIKVYLDSSVLTSENFTVEE